MDEHKSRAAKAADTRRRVVERARELFLDQGYAATSTRQIAAAAEVTERTLFNIVPNKSELLRQVLLDSVFVGYSGPMLEREDFVGLLGASSAEEFLRGFVRWVTSLHTRSAVTAEMVRRASVVDAGGAELWQWGSARQVSDCRALVDLLRQRSWLRHGLTPAEAAASLAVLSGHETYWRFVTELGWTSRRYARWLNRHCLELIGSAAQPAPS